MRVKIIPSILFWVLFFTATGASADGTGSSWLKIPVGAREAAQGGASGAFSGVDSVDFNPAGLSLLGEPEITLSQNFWVQGFSLSHLAYGQPLQEGSGFAVGGDYMAFGDISKYGVEGGAPFLAGTYSPLALNFFAGLGADLSRNFQAGIVVRFLYDNLQTTANESGALDAGFLYEIPATGFSIQAAINDLGLPLDGATLPTRIRLGVDYRLQAEKNSTREVLGFSLEENLFLWDSLASSLGLGGEYWLDPGLAFRAGYRFSDEEYAEGLSGLSLGAGLKFKDWNLDYALTTLGDLGTTQQIDLSLAFNGKSAAPLTARPEISEGEIPNFSENLHFDSGQDQISARDKEAAAEAAQVILQKYRDHLVLIVGHTDNLDLKNSKFTSNQELSLARAETVKEILVEKGLDPTLLQVSGFGDSQPLVSNSTAEGQAQNRRVELRVYLSK